MTTSDIISISLLAMVLADVVVSVFLVRPYYTLKARYSVLVEQNIHVIGMAEKHQVSSLDLIDKLEDARKDIKRLEKEVEQWKARSIA